MPVLKVSIQELKSNLETGGAAGGDESRRAQAAHVELVNSVDRLGPQAIALVRNQQKRYKNFKTKNKRVPVKEILAALQEKMENQVHGPVQGHLLAAAARDEHPAEDLVGAINTRRSYDLRKNHNYSPQLTYTKVE